tara:strand:- start:105 stop:434 length:330 start_codon:yes stop_codon:yes gene_type:complete
MDEINPNKAVDFLLSNAPAYAKAKAQRIYIEQYRKSLKATLFVNDTSKTVAEREAMAYSHKDYLDLLEGLRDAVEEEEKLRWQMIAAEARIEVWRSQEASNRVVDRAFK